VIKFLKKLNLHRHTIARDLAIGLVATITLVFGFAGTINYFYSVERDTAALYEKATEIMDNLASVLVTPMWNLNTDELGKIIDVYRQSGIVLDIRLYDDAGAELVPPRRSIESAFLEMTRVIHHDRTPIGRVTVGFSDDAIVAKQREIAVYSAIVFAFVTFSLIIATTMLLKQFLNEPFTRLKDGLDYISAGNYGHKFPPARQADINDISENVMVMASEIARRESALEQNRHKLEILNQAILDIFSCSDTDSLIRTTMLLTHKVCGVDAGWFLGKTQTTATAEEEKASSPAPLVCVRGHTFEATEHEVEPHIGHENDRTFTFPIKSRYRTVGEMTLAFDTVPDPSVTSLLKSLMSLATLAMIRQSFIRETAFIAAELQVAETVQRSMLPDESKLPVKAAVAYHYEPVLRVGGDWFSIIESRDGDSLYIILGDVTGHGLAQGLVTTAMAGAINIVEAIIHEFGGGLSRPSQIVTQLNNVIGKIAGKSNLRMTCVAAKIDFKKMQLFICNAGHTFPVLLRQERGELAKVESLSKLQQYMLGEPNLINEDHSYTDAVYDLGEHDQLIFYTDGLTEAVDKEGKAFARKFHRHFSKQKASRNVQQVKDDLIKLLRGHTDEVPVKDDICLVVVSKKQEKQVAAA
jgi:serine phosphatase RsbU (regulator of sigma subunit)